jgi:hypothetical protein
MKEKERRRVVTELLDKLRGEVLAAVDKMPEDWDAAEVSWYLTGSALTTDHPTHRGSI